MPKSVTELEQELNQALQDQKVLEAFEQFYAEDVIMQENSGESCSGKAANRQRTLEWAATVSQFHAARLIGASVSDDRAYSEWEYDVTYKNGARYQINQVAVRVWRNGQVVSERFYWDPAKYPYAL
jgi:ketosteroid isomerase-like protein